MRSCDAMSNATIEDDTRILLIARKLIQDRIEALLTSESVNMNEAPREKRTTARSHAKEEA